jgi:hypothetical protein
MATDRSHTEPTKADMTRYDVKPQEVRKHPDEYARDLNPDWMAGQNLRERAEDVDPRLRYASEIKEITRFLQDFEVDELREIPVLPAGARLEQGATYVNLRDPARAPFTATAEMAAGTEDWLVPKNEVPYPYWNRLIHASPAYRRR